MPSDLQRVAQGLVECLDRIPDMVGYLQRLAVRCREMASIVADSTGSQSARTAALQLDAAARACDEAAQYAAMAPPAARAWAEVMVSGARTSNGPSAGEDPASGWRPPPRRLDDRGLLLRLPVQRQARGHRQKTEGLWQDDEGNLHKLISGQHEPEWEAARDHAWKLGIVPKNGLLSTAADVELKFAMKMRREGILKAVIVLNKEPCRGVPDENGEGAIGCHDLLDRFLPPGAELVIHAPNNFQYTYRGKSENQ
jgi:hypothetical protein